MATTPLPISSRARLAALAPYRAMLVVCVGHWNLFRLSPCLFYAASVLPAAQMGWGASKYVLWHTPFGLRVLAQVH